VLLVLSTVAVVMTSPLYEQYREIEAAQNVSNFTVKRTGFYCSLGEKQ
jgi:hypothetical protein